MKEEIISPCKYCGKDVAQKHWLTWISAVCEECKEKHKDDIRPVASTPNNPLKE